MDSKLSRLCDGLLEAGWLTAIISVPLFFNIHSERVFEPDKLTLMRSIAVFMALIWLVKFIDQKGWQRWERLSWRHEQSFWRMPFVLPIVALVLVYIISTIFSVTPRASWAGSYQRLQGTYTMLAYIVIGGVAASTIRSRAQIGRLVTAAIVTSLPVSLYGLIQHFGLDPLPWGGDVTVRVAGHMGNAIFIAAYLIMVVPLTLGRIIDAFTNILSDEVLSYADVIRSGVYIFLLGIQLLSIYWSGSRGPLIALGAALFSFTLILLVSLRDAAKDRQAITLKDISFALVFLIPAVLSLFLGNVMLQAVSSLASFTVFIGVVILSVLMIFLFVALRIGWRWLWLSWLLLTAFVGGWLLLFNISESRMESLQRRPVVGGIFEAHLAWKELPVIGSYGRMLDPTQNVGREKSNRVRVLIWDGVIDLITPHEPLEYPDGRSDPYNFLRPLIGYGPESMYQAYNRFYPPELATVEARNATPDRSHNETFDALVITGLAGFLAWQALYVSVFYYGFHYLGVVRSRRDRNFLLGAWIGGGLLGGILSLTVFEAIYFGVAVPTGTIVGLVVYLFYYALFSSGQGANSDGEDSWQGPFHVDRLLMNALLAAVLAHYVEIHFGIAISSTRLYFFLFVALMFLVSTKLPRLMRDEHRQSIKKSKQRASRKKNLEGSGTWGPVLMWSFLLALVVGTMGFEFINYVLPEGQSVASGADLTALDVFHQSLFVNSQQGFHNAPYVYLMLVLSWALASLIVISEMVKQRLLSFSLTEISELPAQHGYLAVAVLGMFALAGLATRFVLAGQMDPTASLSSSVALIGAVVAVWAAVSLLQDAGVGRPIIAAFALGGLLLTLLIMLVSAFALDLLVAAVAFAAISLWSMLQPRQQGSQGRFTAVAVAAAGLAISLPVITTSGWTFGLLTALLCTTALYLLWDKAWRGILLPALAIGAISWIIGLTFTFVHAVNLREALLYLIFYQEIPPISTLFSFFFRPTEAIESVQQLRVLEALQSIRFLSWYYLFLFTMLILAGISLAWRAVSRSRTYGSMAAYGALFAAAIVAIIVINQTNLRVVQADMIYKRGKPFDAQAMNQNDPQNWDVAIAIYEKALELAPWEDFYYLFLGRAYLERSAAATNEAELTSLYNTAEDLLIQAQTLNPLNTDHTANLARLYTRWYAADPENNQSVQLLQESETYYQEALELSPQNSIIRNEYARLALELKRNCDQALAIYEESIDIDPFYVESYTAMTEALVACAAAQMDESESEALYTLASEILAEGLTLDQRNVRGWLRLGQIRQQIGDYEGALRAFSQARAVDRVGAIPSWNIDYAEASVYQDMGDTAMARALAEQALRSAPTDIAAQIEAFLVGLAEE